MAAENAQNPIGIKKIYQIDQHHLGIDWTDASRSKYKLSDLRRACPCATCVDEWTGKALLDPDSVDDKLVASRVDSVGRYAIRIDFSDGHNTGIFRYGMLRDLNVGSASG